MPMWRWEWPPSGRRTAQKPGSLLVIAGALAAGAQRFRQALAVAPDDLITTFNLAQALLELDPDEHRNEADRLLLRVIEAQPYSELAAKAKAGCRSMSPAPPAASRPCPAAGAIFPWPA